MRDRERERGRDTGRGRSRLHAGSLSGIPSRVSRIRPWAEGDTKPLSHWGCPRRVLIKVFLFLQTFFAIQQIYFPSLQEVVDRT